MKKKIGVYDGFENTGIGATMTFLHFAYNQNYQIVALKHEFEGDVSDPLAEQLFGEAEYLVSDPEITKLVVVPGFSSDGNKLTKKERNTLFQYANAGGNVLAVCDGVNQMLPSYSDDFVNSGFDEFLPCAVSGSDGDYSPRAKKVDFVGVQFRVFNEIGTNLWITPNGDDNLFGLCRTPGKRFNGRDLWDSVICPCGNGGRIVYMLSHYEIYPDWRFTFDFARKPDLPLNVQRLKAFEKFSKFDNQAMRDMVSLLYDYVFNMGGDKTPIKTPIIAKAAAQFSR
jgi:hypothetical protein